MISIISLVLPLIAGAGIFKFSNSTSEQKFSFEYISNDPGAFLLLIVSTITLFLMICSTILYRDEKRLSNKRTCLAIEHLSFPSSTPGLMLESIPNDLKRYNRLHMPIHTTTNATTEHFDLIKDELRQADKRVLQGDADNWFPVYGAIAHVPMVAYAGHQWGNRRPVTVMDFKRETNEWHTNDSLDDGGQLQFTNLPMPGQKTQEISLCVELSIKLDDFAMENDFTGIPRYYVNYTNKVLGIDLLSSTEKQERFIISIGNYLNDLIKRHNHINIINIFVTAQSSFVFRLGKMLQQPHFPDTLIHQYDRNGIVTKHPWSVRLNFAGGSYVQFY